MQRYEATRKDQKLFRGKKKLKEKKGNFFNLLSFLSTFLLLQTFFFKEVYYSMIYFEAEQKFS